jgi:hypothetical protein
MTATPYYAQFSSACVLGLVDEFGPVKHARPHRTLVRHLQAEVAFRRMLVVDFIQD